jgi:hypothetical protein
VEVRPKRRRVVELWVPDLSSVLALATLVYCLFVYRGPEKFFQDSDAGWHIRTGESILMNRALPRTDPYSFSKPGAPWIAWEWGSDVLLGLAHRAAGLRGVSILIALTIAASTWMCCKLAFATSGDFLLLALLAPPMITTASLHWLARPHVFSWILLIGTVLYCERLHSAPPVRAGTIAAVTAVSAFWANMHASFFLGPAIALVYSGSHFLRPLIWPADAEAEQARGWKFVWIALAAAAGSMLNPYGWRLHEHVWSYLRNEDLLSHVAEYQSFNFHSAGAFQISLAVGIASLGGILALTQRKIAHFLLAVVLLWAGLRSARALPLVALVLLPLANGAIIEALRGARLRFSGTLEAALDYSGRLRAIDLRMNGAALTAAVVLLVFLAMPPAGFSRAEFPVNAMYAVERLSPDSRLLTFDGFGGYLIYRFKGTRKVFIDGRSDFYGAEFMTQYLTLIEARPGWRETVDKYGFTHALLPANSPLLAALEQAGWTRLYADNVAVLLGQPFKAAAGLLPGAGIA